MENRGIFLSEFPHNNLQKFYDILEYDGPILSHYKNSSGNNFLFYWIGFDESFNKWIFWEVEFSDLNSYLLSHISLRALILTASSVIITDIDRDINYNNSHLYSIENVPEEHLPEEDSYYGLEYPTIYKKEEEINNKYYVKKLREIGYKYRIINSLNNSINGEAIAAKDAGQFLLSLSKSATAYTLYSFYETYKSEIKDPDNLKRTLANVEKITEVLVADSGYGSFEVTLSLNTVSSIDSSYLKGFMEWKKSILSKYYDDVINIDYASESGIKFLQDKFPEDNLRNRIVKPIADILVDDSFVLTSTPPQKKPVRLKKISRKTYKRIFNSKQKSSQPASETKKILNLIIEVTEKDGKTYFGKRTIDEGLLLREEQKEVDLNIESINYKNNKIIFKDPVVYTYSILEDNSVQINCPLFDVTVKGNNRKEALNNFHNSLGELIVENIAVEGFLYKIYIDEIVDLSNMR